MYVWMPALLFDLQAVRKEDRFREVQRSSKKYTNPLLLIIDEWFLLSLIEKDTPELLELIHKRRRRSSAIFSSQ